MKKLILILFAVISIACTSNTLSAQEYTYNPPDNSLPKDYKEIGTVRLSYSKVGAGTVETKLYGLSLGNRLIYKVLYDNKYYYVYPNKSYGQELFSYNNGVTYKQIESYNAVIVTSPALYVMYLTVPSW